MRAAGVPIIPGTTDPVETVEEVLRLGDEVGYPLIVKAAAGGGGKGMKVVASPEEAERAFESAQREGEKYFADAPRLRRALPRGSAPRRGAGARGRARQRHPPRRARLHDPAPPPEADRGDAVAGGRRGAARADRADRRRRRPRGRLPLGRARSRGCSTADGAYYFMEMNTRIQVEHTVTEEVTGIDLVREQVLIAAGRAALDPAGGRRPARPRDRVPDQRRGRRPAASCPRPGGSRPTASRPGPGVRVDSGVVAGSEISGLYDPMIAKLIVHGVDREHARQRMLRALDEFEIGGVTTLLGFHRALLAHPCFVAGGDRATASSSRRSWRRRRRS